MGIAEDKNCWAWGFSLVEVIVVMGITVLLASILIVFSSQSRNMLLLGVEQTKVAQIILRAKTLAISTYGGGGPTEFCGFGVHFDPIAGSYEIFQWHEATKVLCKTMAKSAIDPIIASGDPRYVRVGAPNVLPPAFMFGLGVGTVSDVFFVPPDPVTDVWVVGTGLSPNGTVQISTKDGAQTATVTITNAGQVSP